MELHRHRGSQEEVETLYALCRAQGFDLVVDSRLVNDPVHTLFFALVGERVDGHDFIPELYDRGVRNFVISRTDRIAGQYPEARVYRCTDPLHLLQALAAHHRRQFSALPVLAVTGSNGKTIVKDWLTQVLRTKFKVCVSPRSYNSQIGVPLSVWQIAIDDEIAVFEVGISGPGEMTLLHSIVRPTVGILTNIGTAHLSNFSDHRQLALEKLSLFEGCEWLLTFREERGWVETAPAATLPQRVLYCDADRQGQLHDRESVTVLPQVPPALADVYRKNAQLVVAAAHLLGLPHALLADELSRLLPLGNRLERREGRDGGPIINDSYSNDLSALAAALTFAEGQDPFGSLTLILGDVQPLPELDDKLVALLAGRVQRLLLVGRRHASLARRLDAVCYATVEELLLRLPTLSFRQQTVLIKGSSAQQLSRVADALSRHLHRTLLRVDLSALRQNFLAYRRLLPSATGIIVMTKASAYGSGALPVARMLQQIGADRLAVAYPEEGRALREGGITLPIMVLNAEPYSFGQLVDHLLEAVIHDRDQLRQAVALRLPVHLELDTGMGRLGFRPTEFEALVREKELLAQAQLVSIFTHLAASEDETHDDFTRRQLELFDRLYSEYRTAGNTPVERHALNSNGISRFAEHHYEMVRLGIGLYGLSDATRAASLQPALRLTTTITSLSERPAGETIGYGRRGKLTGRRTIAVLSIGYADGLPRLAGEGRFSVKVRGQWAPTVGSICMDMCMVDVTDVAGARVQDEVSIFGPDHPIELLAAAARTIPYEILTGIGERVHRVYSGE